MDISVCIPTFRRPTRLSRALDSLMRLRGTDAFAF